MEFFRIHRDIPFMRHALVFNVISLLTFLIAVFFLVTRGLHLSNEFTGGTLIEARYAQAAEISKVRATVEALQFGDVQVQTFGDTHNVLIRLPIRGDSKQSEVVTRVFGELCKVEAGTVSVKPVKTDKGELIDKPVCEAAGAEQVSLRRSVALRSSAVSASITARDSSELFWPGFSGMRISTSCEEPKFCTE